MAGPVFVPPTAFKRSFLSTYMQQLLVESDVLIGVKWNLSVVPVRSPLRVGDVDHLSLVTGHRVASFESGVFCPFVHGLGFSTLCCLLC